jgi:ribosomal protein S18 acetylase RimI-like enzyme
MDDDIFKFEPITEENIDILAYMHDVNFQDVLDDDRRQGILTGSREFGFLVKAVDRYVGEILCRWYPDAHGYRRHLMARGSRHPYVLYLSSVSVIESHRGCGVGRRMLNHVMRIGRRASHFSLHVRVSNEAAQRLYRRHGFTIAQRVHRYYHDEDAFYMTAPNPRH